MANRDMTDHLKLMADLSEVIALLSDSRDLQGFLDRAVAMVGAHLAADVCSIYLYDEHTRRLTLSASRGLSEDAVGRVHLEIGEGLVGKALKELRPICIAHASAHPEYRYFPGVGEEPYDAFLAVPIRKGIEKVGVLVVQRDEKHLFNNTEVMAMRALTGQLATAIETVRALRQVSRPPPGPPREIGEMFVRGRSASPGYALADAVIFARRPVETILKQRHKPESDVGSDDDLHGALEETARQLERLQTGLGARLPEVASLIFESHMMMLKDESFTGQMFDHIKAGKSASRAVAEVAERYISIFEASAHDYIREKARDVEDLTLRLISNLSGGHEGRDANWRGRIVIVHELLPSDILRIALEEVAGIIQVSGGLTSHVSILVRSLSVPMVLADDHRLLSVRDGTQVLLDANVGNVYVNPSAAVIGKFHEREKVRETVVARKAGMVERSFTSDGRPIKLLANINLLSELDLALELKAEGVGLYRTEFPFLIRQTLPSEDEQYAVYVRLLDRMQDRDVTIRTLDAGGDKVLASFDDAGEPNPALGLRSTRLTLRYGEIFDHQLRAIIRAGAGVANLRVMFPMIASLDEFNEARRRVLDCVDALREEHGADDLRTPQIGMMVELPAVLELLDEFADAADFFSIGTNDFIQYMLAVDRTNEHVAEFYCPHHPSVLRGLKRIADAAARHGIDCAVCGEMAHDARYVPFFLGIGIERLSVDPHYLPEVQACIGRWSSSGARDYAEALLRCSMIRDVAALLR